MTPHSSRPPEELLDVARAVDYLKTRGLKKLTAGALAAHRFRGTGPQYFVILSRVYYTRVTLDAWIDKKLADSVDSQRRAERAQL